jgi:hypothetical protein
MIKLAALVSLIATLCFACMPAKFVPSLIDQRTTAERAEDRSVALIENGHARCSGVWLAGNRILTAFHCIRDAGRPAEDDLAKALDQLGLGEEWDPLGHEAHYTDRAGSEARPMTSYTAVVAYVDAKDDLAILGVGLEAWPLHHDYTQLSSKDIRDGDAVDVVGSTAGLPFSYSHGYVGATRPGEDSKSFKVLQVSAPIYFGNSGGGVFDMDGNLLGIADFVISHDGVPVPCLGFAIHRDVILEFLYSIK